MHGCANPLFVKWVEELRDSAKEKGHQSHYTFSKASWNAKPFTIFLCTSEESDKSESGLIDPSYGSKRFGEPNWSFSDKKLENISQTKTDGGVSETGCGVSEIGWWSEWVR